MDKPEIDFLTVLEGKRCKSTLPPPGDRREFLPQPQGTEAKLTDAAPVLPLREPNCMKEEESSC